MIQFRIASALEQQCRIFLICDVNHQRVKMLVGKLLGGRLRIIREGDRKLKLAQHLGHEPGSLLLGAEK